MAKLNRFQMREVVEWKGLTRDNHLASLFRIAPQKASDLMVELLAYQQGGSLDTLLSQFPTKEFENDEEFYWDVIGSSRTNQALVEARDEAGNVITTSSSGNVGANTAPFTLVFDKDMFADGETIVGNFDIYKFRILGDGRLVGSNVEYSVELEGGNEDGVPAERLLPGELFSVEAAYVEAEMSREVGDVRFSAPVSMRNEFTHIRLKHKVPGNKLNKQLKIGIPIKVNGKSQITEMWMHKVDYEVEQQFREYKNNALADSRSNRNSNGEYTNIGKSGSAIKKGAGLYEQMEVANCHYYNDINSILKLIENALYDLVSGRIDYKNRTFVLTTGAKGAEIFNKAVGKEVSGWTPLFQFNGDNLGVVKKTTNQIHDTALSAGYMFTEYRAPMGVTLKVNVDPSYDDPVKRGKILHPAGGFAYSYRFDIMDIGTMDQPNIFKVGIKGKSEYRGYQWGPFRNPFTGQTDNPNASYDEDSAVIHKYADLGVCVLDPTRTVHFIPSVLEA